MKVEQLILQALAILSVTLVGPAIIGIIFIKQGNL